MQTELKLHHLGVACRNIEKEFHVFEKLGYRPISDVFEDKIQKIRGLFIVAKDQPCLELLENLTSDGPLNSHLAKGNKFYHMAYQTENIESDVKDFTTNRGARIIIPITEATYFKKICFMVMPNMMIVELIQLKEEK